MTEAEQKRFLKVWRKSPGGGGGGDYSIRGPPKSDRALIAAALARDLLLRDVAAPLPCCSKFLQESM